MCIRCCVARDLIWCISWAWRPYPLPWTQQSVIENMVVQLFPAFWRPICNGYGRRCRFPLDGCSMLLGSTSKIEAFNAEVWRCWWLRCTSVVLWWWWRNDWGGPEGWGIDGEDYGVGDPFGTAGTNQDHQWGGPCPAAGVGIAGYVTTEEHSSMQLTWIERKLSFVYCKSNKPTLVPTHAELLAARCITPQAADIALREAKEEQRLNLMTAKKAASVTTELLALRGTGGSAKSRALSQDTQHGPTQQDVSSWDASASKQRLVLWFVAVVARPGSCVTKAASLLRKLWRWYPTARRCRPVVFALRMQTKMTKVRSRKTMRRKTAVCGDHDHRSKPWWSRWMFWASWQM